MNPTSQLHAIGQSLWLDNITRGLLSSGTLRRYLADFSVTGLTSNPTIFDQAIAHTAFYDDAIRRKAAEGKSGEDLFFELALEDLGQAADLFRPIHDQTQGMDGWVSLEVSPLLAYDTRSTVEEAKALHARGRRPNLFIKIPGTEQGLPAIEESIFAGVPINVTLLFSDEQYLAAANAYMRGIERRLAAGLNPVVRSVASLFVSRWDKALQGKTSEELRGRVGIAVAGRTYRAYRELLSSARWKRLAAAGAAPQRLLWASTGTKDPGLSDVLYVIALAAPDTINTMPENTLLAFANHGMVGELMRPDGGDADLVLNRLGQAGTDVGALAATLQREGAEAFVTSWKDLLSCLEAKSATLRDAALAGDRR
jgi:transaldolase